MSASGASRMDEEPVISRLCRVRAFNEEELEQGESNRCVLIDGVRGNRIALLDGSSYKVDFGYEEEDEIASQAAFNSMIQPLVDRACEGRRGVLLSGGVSSSGKFAALFGNPLDPDRSVLSKILSSLSLRQKQTLDELGSENCSFETSCSLVELVGEELIDGLASDRLNKVFSPLSALLPPPFFLNS